MAIGIATEYKISTTTFTNLINCESSFDAATTSPDGHDRGIMQINDVHHKEISDSCAYDGKCAMTWAAGYIAKHGWDEWVCANCYLFAETKVGPLPLMQDIKPNTSPFVGALAILNFKGIIHYQVVTGIDSQGYSYIGANRTAGMIKRGHDDWNDLRLIGFWKAATSAKQD